MCMDYIYFSKADSFSRELYKQCISLFLAESDKKFQSSEFSTWFQKLFNENGNINSGYEIIVVEKDYSMCGVSINMSRLNKPYIVYVSDEENKKEISEELNKIAEKINSKAKLKPSI